VIISYIMAAYVYDFLDHLLMTLYGAAYIYRKI
jgi:hypothetical protein